MTALETLVTSLVTAGMSAADAAALVARAIIEATAKKKSSGAERQARWRERHKTSQSVTEASSHSTVTVTSQALQSVTSDAECTESAPLSILPSSIESQPLGKKKEVVARARGARLPDDWQPTPVDHKFAADRGLRLYEIDIEATKFRNYWTNRTDKQAAKPRWDRAWQNWILNFRPPANGQRNNVIAAADELVDAMRQWETKDDLLEDTRGGEGEAHVRLLSAHGRS